VEFLSEHPTARPPRLPKSAPRVRLAIVEGPGKGQSVELTRCVSFIGGRTGCKLQLRDREVSPVHCAIVNTGEEVFLRDLVSKTGTYLNDLKARFETLESGDTIRIAGWELRVDISMYTVDTLSDLPMSLEPEPTAFGVEVNGSKSLVKLEHPVGLVGRLDGCDVLVRDRQVSRAHLLLFTYLGEAVFCDVLSNNGVFVNEEQAGFGPLRSGDRLELGPQTIRVILPGAGRRLPSGPTGSSGAQKPPPKLKTAPPPTTNGSTDGTAVLSVEDTGDRINIRAAESDSGTKG